jgi:hypothetical protein
MDEINFTGRRPSLAQCIKAAKLSAARGHSEIRLLWGENWCEVSRQSNGRWSGFGWLRTIDACKVAEGLNVDPVAAAIVSRTGVPAGRLIVSHIGG